MSPPKRARESTEELRATLVAHATDLVAREGAAALTMRALAAEAGCSVGLPYKVFTDRTELVAEVIHAEFARLQAVFHDLLSRAGTGTVGGNLAWLAGSMLDSPAVALTSEVMNDDLLRKTVTSKVHASGAGPALFEMAIAGYLAAEKREGRVDASVDEHAFGFALAGAIHNLIVSGGAYPKPSRRQLRRYLDAIAARLAPAHSPEESDASR